MAHGQTSRTKDEDWAWMTRLGLDDILTVVEHTVFLKVENGGIGYYIGFNRKAGINCGTKEAPDLVQIVIQGDGISPSYLVEKLGTGDAYQITTTSNV
jgi:hypothetical protein